MPVVTSLPDAIAQFLLHLVTHHDYKLSEMTVEMDEDFKLIFTRKRGDDVQTWSIEPEIVFEEDETEDEWETSESETDDEDEDLVSFELENSFDQYQVKEKER